MDGLRAVTALTSAAAEVVLPHFDELCPDDTRPGQALAAALAFARGDPRSNAQRVSAAAAHRAGKEANSELAYHAAMAAGDAAAFDHCAALATPLLIDVLRRYPGIGSAPGRVISGSTRVSHLVNKLDELLRAQPNSTAGHP